MENITEIVRDGLSKIEAKIYEHGDRIADLEQKRATMHPTEFKAATGIRATIQQKLLGAPEMAALRTKGVGTGLIDLGLELKALTSATGDQSSSEQVGISVSADKITGSMYGYGQRPLSLLEALPVRRTGSNRVSFNRAVGFSPAAAAQEYEGAAKAEQTLTPELVEAPVSTVATYIVLSRQVADDEIGLSLAIENMLRHTVLAKAESEVLNGTGLDGRMRGILTDAGLYVPSTTTVEDMLSEAKAEMESDGYFADLAVVHPRVWGRIQRRKATGGSENYLIGSPAAPIPPALWGMRVIVTPAIDETEALLVDSRYTVLLDRQSVTAELFPQDSDNVRRNLVTLRVEGRWGVALLDTGAAAKLSISSSD